MFLATHVRCGRIFSDEYITSFLLSLTLKVSQGFSEVLGKVILSTFVVLVSRFLCQPVVRAFVTELCDSQF